MVISFAGAPILAGSFIFSFPLTLVLGSSAVIRMGVVVVVGGEISREKIRHFLVTLLDPDMLVMSTVSYSSIQESYLIPW